MKKILLAFLGILLLAFFLRSYTFLHGDFFYSVDQARDLLLAKSVVFDHHLTLIGGRTGFGGLFHGVFWIYLITPFMFLAKGNPFWTLIPLYEIVNLGIVIAGFIAGYKLYGKWVGLLIAFFLSISSSLVVATASTTNAEMLPIVVIFYLYSIFQFLRGNNKYFALSLFLIGLGFQFESAFAVLLIPITVMAIIFKKQIPSLRIWIAGILGFLVAVSTFIIFDLRHQFLMTFSALRLFTNTQKPLPGYEEYANLGFRVVDRMTSLANSFFSPLYSKDLLSNLLLTILIAIAAILVVKKLLKNKLDIEKEFLFVLISPVVIFLIYILYPLPLWSHYILPITVFAVCILSISIKMLWERPILKPVILFFIILTAFFPIKDVLQNFKTTYSSNSDGSYLNQLSVANWVYKDSQGKDSSYFIYTPGILTYNMDYLLWWLSYSNKTPQLQSLKKSNTYLIFYPPLTNDTNAYDFWKRNVIHTKAKPKLTKSFQGGLQVQILDLSGDKKQVDPNYFQNLLFR